MTKRALILALCLIAAAMLLPRDAVAESAADEAAYGAGSVLGTVLYAPFKTTFCVVGGVTSGLTLPFGGTATAGKVASAACGGTWAITPGVLKGREPLRFVGGDAKPTIGRDSKPASSSGRVATDSR